MGTYSDFQESAVQSAKNKFPIDTWTVNHIEIRKQWLHTRDEKGRNLHEIFPNVLTDDDYNECVVEAIMYVNEEQPVNDVYSPVDFPLPKLLIDFAFVISIERVIGYHNANRFTATSAGIVMPIHERVEYLQSMVDRRKPDILRRITEFKITDNYMQGFGSVTPPGGYGW